MNDIMFEILKAVVSISVIAIMRYVIPMLKDNYQYRLVLNAVKAAEQQYKDATGSDKREVVIKYATEQLNKWGLKITDEQLRILLESAVYEINANK